MTLKLRCNISGKVVAGTADRLKERGPSDNARVVHRIVVTKRSCTLSPEIYKSDKWDGSMVPDNAKEVMKHIGIQSVSLLCKIWDISQASNGQTSDGDSVNLNLQHSETKLSISKPLCQSNAMTQEEDVLRTDSSASGGSSLAN